ncbi:phage holin family protein [Serratia microhaemolytica]|uniref:phage holin family protein n=1 Tax=Serratia microhaemolytica TaxID=2675110 RepID=UPI000FDF5B4B|nr:phage holin family protein [Serratia microhaemolytica]
MISDIETLLNAIVCTVTAVRLLTFRRCGAGYVRWGAYLAYGLTLATGSVAIRIVMGTYEGPTDPAELFINIVLCFLVLRSRGNVVQLFKVK